MKLQSISQRVYRAILAVSALSMIAMVTTVVLINEDLENTMLSVEFAQEREFILANYAGPDVEVWNTPDLAIVYVPRGKVPPADMPKVFHGLSAGYSAEMEFGDQTWLVAVDNVDTGVLFVAKNITHFENREVLFEMALGVMAMIIMIFSLLLALLIGRRIVRPLQSLAYRISGIPVGSTMPRIPPDYTDVELHSIALSFNRFLDELESYVRREQSLVSLASHELRTPIAVMLGGLDIIDARGQLQPNDRSTLNRVRRSCEEMRDNVNVLLQLARREPNTRPQENVDVGVLARHIINDLAISHEANDRVSLQVDAPLRIQTDAVMAGMLLRNLIQNAVQHTSNQVIVKIFERSIHIEDQGQGLTAAQQATLESQSRAGVGSSSLSGLGLYIVTLIAERLEWQLDVTHKNGNGTAIRLIPPL